MKLFRYLALLSVLGTSQLTYGVTDTMDFIGGSFPQSWSIGWNAESWNDSAQQWCGDTTFKDLTIDTSVRIDTLVLWIFNQVTDTIISETDTQYVVRDTLVPDTTISNDTTYIDSSMVLTCVDQIFIADTGGFIEGQQYINYSYKFRNYWAQLPLVWTGWAGIDATPYKYLLITYQGILPTHQVKMGFFYGWMFDSTKNVENRGDGVGSLESSPAEWITVVIQIPDSVDMEGITGITFNISNAEGSGAGATSEVGNIKLARLSLLANADMPVRYKPAPRVAPSDRFTFVPKTAGKVTVSVYTLKGERLYSTAMGVNAGTRYSVRSLANQFKGRSGTPQMRIIRIQGAGVCVNEKLW